MDIGLKNTGKCTFFRIYDLAAVDGSVNTSFPKDDRKLCKKHDRRACTVTVCPGAQPSIAIFAKTANLNRIVKNLEEAILRGLFS